MLSCLTSFFKYLKKKKKFEMGGGRPQNMDCGRTINSQPCHGMVLMKIHQRLGQMQKYRQLRFDSNIDEHSIIIYFSAVSA